MYLPHGLNAGIPFFRGHTRFVCNGAQFGRSGNHERWLSYYTLPQTTIHSNDKVANGEHWQRAIQESSVDNTYDEGDLKEVFVVGCDTETAHKAAIADHRLLDRMRCDLLDHGAVLR